MASFALQNGHFLAWRDISLHPNPKACAPWLAVVEGYDPATKYNWVQEFREKTYIDNEPYFDSRDLEEGDIIRVSGASHNNNKTQAWRVEEIAEGSLEASRLSEMEAIEALESRDSGDGDEGPEESGASLQALGIVPSEAPADSLADYVLELTEEELETLQGALK